MTFTSKCKEIGRLVVTCALVLSLVSISFVQVAFTASIDAQQQGKALNLSSMPSDTKVPLTVDSQSGATQGVFWNVVKDKIVNIAGNGRVGPIGAGLFLGSAEKRVPQAPCELLVRRTSEPSAFSLLPLTCAAKDLWYLAVVSEDTSVLNLKNRIEKWSTARPIKAGLRSFHVKSVSMPKDLRLDVAKNGSLLDSKASIETLGPVEIFFDAHIGSGSSNIIISTEQARILISRLGSADRETLEKRLVP